MNRPKLGVVSALGLGFESVVRALWVLLVPLALDFFFWLGPRLSIHTLFERLIVAMGETTLPADSQQNWDEVRRFLSDVGNNLNLFSLLATDFAGLRLLPIPSLKAFELPDSSDQVLTQVGQVNLIVLENTGIVLLVGAALLALGLLFGAFFLTLIADRVRAAGGGQEPLLRRVLSNWLRLIVFVAMLFAFYFVVGIPFMLAVTVMWLINEGLGLLLVLLGWMATFWLFFLLTFAIYAIVLDGDGVLRAIWHSANVVRRNLLSTFGFILLSNLIVAGTALIWQSAEASAPGSVFAIVGNAFVGSGLVAATFFFYQDRYQAWREARGSLRAAGAAR